MPKKANKKSSPLLVIATMSPEKVADYKLKYFEDEDGGHIVNADFEQHANPRTGETIDNSEGQDVEVDFDADEMVGVRCVVCSAINGLDAEQASAIKAFNCITCGADITPHFDEDDSDVDADEEEASEDDDDFEDEDDDVEEDVEEVVEQVDEELNEDDDDFEDEDEEDEDEEDVETDEDDLEAEAALASFIDDNAKISFGILGDKVVAFAGDVSIATYESTDKDDLARKSSTGYAESMNRAIITSSVEEVLVQAGFKPVVVNMDALTSSRIDEEVALASVNVDAKVEASVARFNRCMDIVAAGAIRGFFAKGTTNVLMAGLTENLKELNIANANRVARKILANTLSSYNNGLIEETIALTKKSDVGIATLEETIRDSDPSALPVEEVEDDENDNEIVARFITPAKASEIASVSNQQNDSRFTGLFGKK